MGRWETLNYEIKERELLSSLAPGSQDTGTGSASEAGAAGLLLCSGLFFYVCSHRPHRKGLVWLSDWMIIVGSKLMPGLSEEVRGAIVLQEIVVRRGDGAGRG